MSVPAEEEVEQLTAVADLFAALLLREVDRDLIESLEASGADVALRSFNVSLPAATEVDALDALAAEYFEVFVKPLEGPPMIQSLAEGDAFEGPPADAMRAIAEACGVDFDPVAARGAPVDHLGAQLSLWASLRRRDAEAASAFADRHLRWATRHLERRRDASFYGQLSGTVADFIGLL